MKRNKQMEKFEEIHDQVELMTSVLLDLIDIGIEDHGNERGHTLSLFLASRCIGREIQRLQTEFQHGLH
jgi:hypothetical protein